jgi:hypothetical protein
MSENPAAAAAGRILTGSAKVLIFPHMQQNFFRLKQPEFYAILCLNFNTGPPMPGKTGPATVRDYYK